MLVHLGLTVLGYVIMIVWARYGPGNRWIKRIYHTKQEFINVMRFPLVPVMVAFSIGTLIPWSILFGWGTLIFIVFWGLVCTVFWDGWTKLINWLATTMWNEE